ncbi:MAG: lipoprotein insertase outer membrane protein LolB [Pseudomonadota bacterium]
MKRYHYLLIAVLLLSACTQTPRIESGEKTQLWLEHQITASAIQSWNIKGRVAVKNSKQSGTITLFWNQFLANYELRFLAPLGQGTYILSGTPNSVIMKTPKENIIEAENPEQLLRDVLNWDVHLNGLRYWVRGLPEPGVEFSSLLLDDKGRLTNMDQSGFNINVSRYTEIENVSLPEKLSIESDNIRLKVIIQNWNI